LPDGYHEEPPCAYKVTNIVILKKILEFVTPFYKHSKGKKERQKPLVLGYSGF
jgi:hypothetical protein